MADNEKEKPKAETVRTLEEVGKAFDVTRERIRQMENKALRKLRVQLWKRGINSADDFID